ncbi:cytochrome c [Flaviramulus sp. BrNp1-15]|uniref:c-type cytochrome n=1 Tax=Flaviramulus sp. BrNp1-15 TaxID=2916754 RepID=UPI001EE7A447|nr:cytochrome c [Flaviramulus sp. BrNp1-15]ULC59475.1 cytochrome c [Flaviramulus sp. BrNp1-15]
MKTTLNIVMTLFLALLISCGGKEEKKKEGFSYEKKTPTEQTVKKEETVPASQKVDLENKGVGPIKSLALNAEIDQKMVAHGADVFKKMCTACHRPDKKFIGPAPTGLLDRRSPEWVMNMILNPEEMVQKDPLAKELLIEFNGSPMANQNLTEEEARAVLEYFRTL